MTKAKKSSSKTDDFRVGRVSLLLPAPEESKEVASSLKCFLFFRFLDRSFTGSFDGPGSLRSLEVCNRFRLIFSPLMDGLRQV